MSKVFGKHLGNHTLLRVWLNKSRSHSTLVSNSQHQLFNAELERQRQHQARIEKIKVNVINIKPHDDCTLMMNKNVSTPYECAKHISQLHTTRSVAALIDNDKYWDMHRPLENDCTIEFKHFKEEHPGEVNRIYWRSCSYLLGMAIKNAFKESVPIYLHSWPKPDVRSGSFVYDAQLPTLENWKPREDELRTLSASFFKIKSKRSRFERLTVSTNLAKQIFSSNPLKVEQIEQIEKTSEDAKVTLYRVDNHIDYSIGPMIPDTSFVGRVTVTAVHKLTNPKVKQLYRFQGVSLPTQVPVHFYPYKILTERARRLNTI